MNNKWLRVTVLVLLVLVSALVLRSTAQAATQNTPASDTAHGGDPVPVPWKVAHGGDPVPVPWKAAHGGDPVPVPWR
jgi:hypothetical protein